MRLNLSKKKKYLLACSYGPDSMALLFYLYSHKYDFDVAFVNYHLRDESKQEEFDIKKYCEEKNIKIFVYEVKEQIISNVENRCREIRYNFFHSLFTTNSYDTLLTAHHLDDFIETYLLQKKRKSLLFYYGIKSPSIIKNMTVVRPLLKYEKQYLLNYDRHHKVPFAIDQTNLTNVYQRNIIRNTIIKNLSVEEKKHLFNKINKMNKDLNKFLKTIQAHNLHSVKYLITLDETTFIYALNILAKQYKEYISISKNVAINIKKALLSAKPNISIKLLDDIYFFKSFDFAYVSNEDDLVKNYSFIINKPSKINNEFFYLDFTLNSKNRNISLDDYPLLIRPANKNDVYKINGYDVSIFDLYKDYKMPLFIRYRWPIILNKNNHIIYVPRYKENYKKKKNENFFVKI